MTIQIRDAELEARLQKQLEVTGSSLEELLLRLLESQEEQDRWLLEIEKDSKPSYSVALSSLIAAKEFLRTD